MKKYAVNGLSASGTATKSAFTLTGASTVRPLVSEITFGVRTPPNATDQQVEFQCGSTTAAGTSTAATPKPLDVVDPVAAQVTGGITHSAEPTYGTYWIDSDMNQRGLYRWVAEIGFELAGAATSSNGVGAKLAGSTAAVQMSMVVHYKE